MTAECSHFRSKKKIFTGAKYKKKHSTNKSEKNHKIIFVDKNVLIIYQFFYHNRKLLCMCLTKTQQKLYNKSSGNQYFSITFESTTKIAGKGNKNMHHYM